MVLLIFQDLVLEHLDDEKCATIRLCSSILTTTQQSVRPLISNITYCHAAKDISKMETVSLPFCTLDSSQFKRQVSCDLHVVDSSLYKMDINNVWSCFLLITCGVETEFNLNCPMCTLD